MLFSRVLETLAPRNQPWMTRQSYAHELVSATTFPVALSMVEGGVVGVLAKKIFEVSDLAFATILAAPMFANLTSFFWAHLARGRPKVRFITGLQVMVLLMVASVAALPTESPGPLLLVCVVLATRCFLAGSVTIRSTLWRMNYPRRVRARITGRLALVVSLIMAIGPTLGYFVLDLNPQSFRVLYPLAALTAVIGVAAFSRIRLRGERELLRFERSPAARPQPRGVPGSVYEFDPKQSGDEGFWSVLRRDHFFRRYMAWQFVGGLANMTGDFAIIAIIIDLTSGRRLEYFSSILLTTTIPLLMTTLTLSVWAKYLDRVHITTFKIRHGVFWIVLQVANWIAVLCSSLWVLVIPRMIHGVSGSAGMLAWNLGHNDFADRRLVSLYMGIHVTLTGIRGFIAPYLAIGLLTGWTGFEISGLILPGFAGIGPHVFIVTALINMVSVLGFIHLRRLIRRDGAES